MAREYTIPQILGIAGIIGYSPALAVAANKLLNSKNPIEYQAALKTATIEIGGYELGEVFDADSFSGYDENNHFPGLPIFMPFLFEKIEDAEDDYLLDSAIIDLSRQKNIIITNLQGRETSVKEFINNGDYAISVSGLICSKGVGYPKSRVKEIEKFFKAKTSIGIIHEVLNMLGIYDIVITDYKFPTSPFSNAQPYSFNAISEVPAELKTKLG